MWSRTQSLFLFCEFWIPFWKFWSVSCLQQQKGVGEGKTLKICDVWWPRGEQNWEGFAETLPLKAPELLSYRGLRALPGCGCGEEAPAHRRSWIQGGEPMLCF